MHALFLHCYSAPSLHLDHDCHACAPATHFPAQTTACRASQKMLKYLHFHMHTSLDICRQISSHGSPFGSMQHPLLMFFACLTWSLPLLCGLALLLVSPLCFWWFAHGGLQCWMLPLISCHFQLAYLLAHLGTASIGPLKPNAKQFYKSSNNDRWSQNSGNPMTNMRYTINLHISSIQQNLSAKPCPSLVFPLMYFTPNAART